MATIKSLMKAYYKFENNLQSEVGSTDLTLLPEGGTHGYIPGTIGQQVLTDGYELKSVYVPVETKKFFAMEAILTRKPITHARVAWGSLDLSISSVYATFLIRTTTEPQQRLQVPFQSIENVVYHVMGTYDGSTLRLYVNGEQIGKTRATGYVNGNFEGKFPVKVGFPNSIMSVDEFSIYHWDNSLAPAFTADDVYKLYSIQMLQNKSKDNLILPILSPEITVTFNPGNVTGTVQSDTKMTRLIMFYVDGSKQGIKPDSDFSTSITGFRNKAGLPMIGVGVKTSHKTMILHPNFAGGGTGIYFPVTEQGYVKQGSPWHRLILKRSIPEVIKI